MSFNPLQSLSILSYPFQSFRIFSGHSSCEMKKLSNNSSWYFEHILETIDDYWVGQDENFCPESTATRWRCNHFSKKWPKSKIKKILLNKNLLLPLTSGVEIFLGCTIFEFGFFCLRKLTNNWHKKQKMLQNEFYQKND